MSSGYCTLEEGLEIEQFYTAKGTLPTSTKSWEHAAVEQAGASERNGNVEPPSTKAELPRDEAEEKISSFNRAAPRNAHMTLQPDGSFTGFIEVQLKFRSVDGSEREAGTGRESDGDGGGGGATSAARKLKRRSARSGESTKQVHLSSRTSALEVSEALVARFRSGNSLQPRFALFKCTQRDGQGCHRKLGDAERPLLVRLLAGPDPNALSFLLQENETREVIWEAFSIPELKNFLRILEREEREHVRRVEEKFSRYRGLLRDAVAGGGLPRDAVAGGGLLRDAVACGGAPPHA
ncbi:ras association domain-containing protein 1-like isoform X2 [Lampetra fluviatilis]